MHPTIEWLLGRNFVIVKNQAGLDCLVKNRLVIPVEMAIKITTSKLERIDWAATNWFGFAKTPEGDLGLLSGNWLMNFDFVMDAPIESVTGVQFQDPDIKVN